MPAGASQTARGLRNSSNPTGPIVGTCTHASGSLADCAWTQKLIQPRQARSWPIVGSTCTHASLGGIAFCGLRPPSHLCVFESTLQRQRRQQAFFDFMSIEIEVEILSLAFQPNAIDIDSAHEYDMMFGNLNQGEGWE